MGQKVNPHGFRLGPLYTWDSRWFADDKNYKKNVLEDFRIRKTLREKLRGANLSRIEIERSINKLDIILHVGRPGVVIGRGGAGLNELKAIVEKIILQLQLEGKKMDKQKKIKVEIKVEPIREPDKEATLVAQNIVDQLVRRLPYKRVVKQAMEKVLGARAKGIRVVLSGRIAGAEISRRERFQKGTVPLSTIREDIDYAQIPALTKSGYIGVKVWICK